MKRTSLLRIAMTLALTAGGAGCATPPEATTLPTRAVVESHRVPGVTVYAPYAAVRLPIEHGVPVWNPTKIVRGPEDVMYAANHTGEIYSLRDTDGDGLEDTAHLFCNVSDDGLRNPAGLAFKGRDLYVGTAQEVRVYTDRDGDGRSDTSRTFLGNLPQSEHPYEWTSALTFGPDEALYLVLTTDSWNAGAAPDPEGWRGALLRVAPDGRHVERFATGLRSVHGMVFDAAGTLFFADNQGGNNAVEELNLARRGAFYGHNPAKYGDPPATGPLHALRTEVAPSGLRFAPSPDGTGEDLFVAFYGPGERWARGAIARVRLHRDAGGGYKADEVPVATGLPKISDLAFGLDGSLYATHVGKTDYWYQPFDTPDGGIYRLIPASWVEPVPIDTTAAPPLAYPEATLERGRQLFADLACSACHAIDGKTEWLGPNLKDIGRIYTREELLEEIQEPSRRIKPSMAATRITRTNGEVLLGRVVSAGANQVRLMVVGNRILDVPRAEIETEEPVLESLMWSGLLNTLQEEEVDALLTYLISLQDANTPGG